MAEWEIIGFEKAMQHLDRIKSNMKQNGQIYSEISEITAKSIQSNFQSQGRNPSWPARIKPKSWPLLNKSGRLKSETIQSTQYWKQEENQKNLHITSPWYGKFHQHLEKYAHLDKGIMPVRKYMKFLQNELEQIRNTLRKIIT